MGSIRWRIPCHSYRQFYLTLKLELFPADRLPQLTISSVPARRRCCDSARVRPTPRPSDRLSVTDAHIRSLMPFELEQRVHYRDELARIAHDQAGPSSLPRMVGWRKHLNPQLPTLPAPGALGPHVSVIPPPMRITDPLRMKMGSDEWRWQILTN